MSELRELFRLALPIMATSVLTYFMGIVDLSMAGHLGKEELAAASLGTAFYNCVFYPLNGVAMAFDTYFSQSFGAGNFTAFGTWLIVGSIVLAGVAVPVTLVLIFCEPIMLALDMDPLLVAPAAGFVHRLL